MLSHCPEHDISKNGVLGQQKKHVHTTQLFKVSITQLF